MFVEQKYHKIDFTDEAAHKAFKQYLDSLQATLNTFGLSFNREAGIVSYAYYMGNHILSFTNGQQVMTKKMQDTFEKFVKLAEESIKENEDV
jgi:hypothetical protein